MYIYINKEGKITTQIEHGEPVRQGNALHLVVCFDKDREEELKSYSLSADFKNNEIENSEWIVGYIFNNPRVLPFEKIKSSEMTFDLVDGEEYVMFDKTIEANSGVTKYPGHLSCVLTLGKVENDGTAILVIQEETDINVIATYGGKIPTNNVSQSDFNKLTAQIGQKLDKNYGYADSLTINDSTLEGETALRGSINGSDGGAIYRTKIIESTYHGLQSFQNANVFINDATAHNMPVSKGQLDAHIDQVDARSDVVDVVGTYAEFEEKYPWDDVEYTPSGITNNDIIKVLKDETRNYETTMYRWVNNEGWVFVGAVGPYYTKAESNKNIDEAKSEVKGYTDEKVQALKEEIDNRADVVDVVGTYAELRDYDKEKLTDNDVIKVLQDETHNYATTYYRWFDNVKDFAWLGSVGPYYTERESDERYLKKEEAIVEQHELSEVFYERTTASDSTGSKYEIKDGSLAVVNKLGGMTYKSENLLVIEDVAETTLNGVTYSVKDGVITLNGTATTTTYITLIENLNLPLDTYSYNPRITTTPSGTYLNLKNTDNVYISNYAMTFENTVGGLQLQYNEGTVFSNTEIKIMLIRGATIPTEYQPYYEGLRNTKVTEIVSVGNNLLNNELVDSYDSSATKQNDGSYISKTLGSYASLILNGKYQSTYGEVRALNGIDFKKGTYYISFKAKLNSGTSSNINNVFITRENASQVNTTSVVKPTSLTNSYQTYTRSFELTENGKIGISIQVTSNSSNAVIQVKDIIISKDNIEYQPYWEETLKIPESIQSLDGYGVGINETYNNYIDFERSKFVKTCNVVRLTDLTWRKSTTTTIDRFVGDIPRDNLAVYSNAPILCNLKNISYGGTYGGTNKNYMWLNVGTEIAINIGDYGTTTLEDFKARLNEENPILIYPLATPIETDIDLVDKTYKVDNLGTETLVNEYNQKAFASIEYGVSLKDQVIENSENIANLKPNVENNTTRIDNLETDKLDKQLGMSGTNIVYSATMDEQTTTFLDNNSNTFRFNAIPIRDSYGRLHNSNYIHKGEETELPTSVAITKGYADENYGEKEIVDRLQRRVKQLELASEGTILQTIYDDKEVSYTRVISEYALPNAMLEKVSGMTYKSENILNIDDFSATKNGITYTYSKGHFTIKGTFESAQQYNQVYFNNATSWFNGRTRIEANKTCILCISKPTNRPISMAQNGIGGTGWIEIGNVTKVFSNTKEIILNCIGIGTSTEEDVGTSVDLEFDIWVNEGTTAKPFNVFYEGLRNTKVSEIISNGANLLKYTTESGTTTQYGVTFVRNGGTITIKGTATESNNIYFNNVIEPMPMQQVSWGIFNDKTYNNGEMFGLSNEKQPFGYSQLSTLNKTFTPTLSGTEIRGIFIKVISGINYDFTIKPMLVKGETLPTQYKPYKAPITYSIPSQVQALEGYGIGINGDYNNYIDYDRKVFVKVCKVVQLGGSTKLNNNVDTHITTFGGNWGQINSSNGQFLMQDATLWKDMAYIDINNSVGNFKSTFTSDTSDGVQKNVGNRICVFSYSGTNRIRITFEGLTTKDEAVAYLQNNPVLVIYPLATPIETDISQYLTDDNVIEVEENGTLTFENEHQQNVMNSITYQERII